MARKKRKAPSINSSSSADLAFTLLIFFLVVTSMDTDEGLVRLLPRWTEEQESTQDVKTRNMLPVLINKDNQLMVGEDLCDLSKLCDKAKTFVTATGEFTGDRGPEKAKVDPMKNPELAQYMGSEIETTRKHVISLQSDYGTKYEMYLRVQNELVRAYNELRREAADKYFSKELAELKDNESWEEKLSKEQMQAIKDLYPMNISEANTKY